MLDRLGVGYERLSEENPRLVYCAITGYGQDGPLRDRSGHDMNYLGPIGLLGLTGDADGPPVQAAGQIADLGGGALMAAFGILAALRERDRSGEASSSTSRWPTARCRGWRWSPARHLADGVVPQRGDAELAGLAHLLPPLRVRGRLGHAGRARAEVLAALVRRRRARGPDRAPVRRPRLGRPQEVEAIFADRTRAEWEAFAAEHDCCLEPVLELDEALDAELVEAREMVVELDQPARSRRSACSVPRSSYPAPRAT